MLAHSCSRHVFRPTIEVFVAAVFLLSKEDPRLVVVVIFSCCGSSTTAAASTATAWCGCFQPTGTGGKFIKAIVLRLYLCHRMFVLRQKAAMLWSSVEEAIVVVVAA